MDKQVVDSLTFWVERIDVVSAAEIEAVALPRGMPLAKVRATVAERGGVVDPAGRVHPIDLAPYAPLADDVLLAVTFGSEDPSR